MNKFVIAVLSLIIGISISSAQAATAGTKRTISTTGLTQYNVGNGEAVYTNTPNAVTSFSYNTGSASGTVTSLTIGQ